jgi:aconitate hydratase
LGLLPWQFRARDTPETSALTDAEASIIEGIAGGVTPGHPVTVRASADDGWQRIFRVITRIETLDEVVYYRRSGILPSMLRWTLTG